MNAATDTLVEAATAAGHAPFIQNSQPWRRVVFGHAGTLPVSAEHDQGATSS